MKLYLYWIRYDGLESWLRIKNSNKHDILVIFHVFWFFLSKNVRTIFDSKIKKYFERHFFWLRTPFSESLSDLFAVLKFSKLFKNGEIKKFFLAFLYMIKQSSKILKIASRCNPVKDRVYSYKGRFSLIQSARSEFLKRLTKVRSETGLRIFLFASFNEASTKKRAWDVGDTRG